MERPLRVVQNISGDEKDEIIWHFNEGLVDNLGEALFGIDSNYGDFRDFINLMDEPDQFKFIRFWRKTEKN